MSSTFQLKEKEIIKITSEMFANLEYDKINISTNTKSLNSLKLNETAMKEIRISSSTKLTLQDVFEKININLNLLAQIESNEMSISMHSAENLIKNSISPLKINKTNHQLKLKNIFAIWETNLKEILEQLFLLITFEVDSFVLFVDPSRETFFQTLLIDILKMKIESSKDVNKMQILYLDSLKPTYKTMIVFKAGDLNGAVQQVLNSFDDPFSKSTLRSVYVQESCYDHFCTMLSEKLRPYSEDLLRDQFLINELNKTQEIIKKLNAKIIQSKPRSNEKTLPTISLNFPRRHYDKTSGCSVAPIINMQSFRTVKEAISFLSEEKANSANIWIDNFSIAYEIVNKSKFSYYELNCYDICHYPLYKVKNFVYNYLIEGNETKLDIPKSGVVVEENYHYQFFEDKSSLIKRIVCPFGVTFAN